MTGLKEMLQSLDPALDPAEYVFCSMPHASDEQALGLEPLALFRENEGLSLLLLRGKADESGLDYNGVFQRITLNVFSDLEATGLTAAVSAALAGKGIAANMIAACHHDHILVPASRSREAMELLRSLQHEANDA